MHFEVYRSGYWWWRLKSSNGRTIADGSESYKRKAGCLKSIARMKEQLRAAPVEIDPKDRMDYGK